MKHEAMQTGDLVERPYVLLKRGVFWSPNDCGYTAFRDDAGRYTEAEARARCADGTTMMRAAEAPEFAPKAWDDLVIARLLKQRDEARASLARARAEALGALETARETIHTTPVLKIDARVAATRGEDEALGYARSLATWAPKAKVAMEAADAAIRSLSERGGVGGASPAGTVCSPPVGALIVTVLTGDEALISALHSAADTLDTETELLGEVNGIACRQAADRIATLAARVAELERSVHEGAVTGAEGTGQTPEHLTLGGTRDE